jgi:hypothetical protein
MIIGDCYIGKIEDYKGACPVLVTDEELGENRFYELKLSLFRRGVELVSTRYEDEKVTAFISHMAMLHKLKHGGRLKFGFRREGNKVVLTDEGRAVVTRIFELRDVGYTLNEISKDESVHHPDGRKLSVSTVQQILKNRGKYEETI